MLLQEVTDISVEKITVVRPKMQDLQELNIW